MKIDASPESIRDIFDNEFLIPGYQRPYSWDKEHCGQLLDDLIDFWDNRKEHEKYFLGSIVVHPEKNNQHVLEIIDGQQRLTTMLMLIKVLEEKVSTTYDVLREIMFKKNRRTAQVKESESRLESNVNDSDKRDLLMILQEKAHNIDKGNRFFLNYIYLKENVDEWWKNKRPKQRTAAIDSLLDDVMMLPIRCESQDGALTLFETVNNRGNGLNDADIVKAQIYDAVLGQAGRDKFKDRWNKIKEPQEMLKIYMHISRAKAKIIKKESRLRRYLEHNHLKNRQKPLSKNWKDMMGTLEKCNYITESGVSDRLKTQSEHDIYWGIMYRHPNEYWKYPLFVFLDQHMKKEDSRFDLPEDMHEEYVVLMENTARYFLIKALVHNTLNVVKDTTYKVCKALATKEGDYVTIYEKDAHGDRKEFNNKLGENDLKRYGKCLAFLSASLNNAQNRPKYAELFPCDDGKRRAPQMEHILPDKWHNYDGWTSKTHTEALNKIGNLMPLEKKLNITASNEFFRRKQAVYKKSEIRDAVELADRVSATWHPNDLAQRQEEMLSRLRNFFDEFKRP